MEGCAGVNAFHPMGVLRERMGRFESVLTTRPRRFRDAAQVFRTVDILIPEARSPRVSIPGRIKPH